MKREGRQHGMVTTYRIIPSPWNPRPKHRFIQQLDSPPTAGLLTKVPVKPTNHSKFTGRCGRPRCVGCHMHPACKAKDKTKGTHKLRSSDMATNYRLVTWRVVDGRPGLKFSGFSATRILDHLSNDHEDYCEGNDDHDYDDDNDDDDGFKVNSEGENMGENIVDHNNDDEKNEGVFIDDDDDVKFVLVQDLEEEGWCLVGGI
ncbi:uncharacterized protein LOC111299547 [Durio zibethinus]|uniref:Uncharacterized protein LOC111299547 n=1 Tax=Durio zibethinus TaxID=66656 RepID=A0A6P5ZDF8_DURZI|nr:uncharacterized protein LOC111299547 [Durio zibethinus]